MANLLSPGVAVSEIDQSAVITSAQSSVGAYVGYFSWGPANTPISIGQPSQLVQMFGRPNNSNFQHFFTVYNFLSYPSSALVIRAIGQQSRNAVVTQSGSVASTSITFAGSGYTTAPQVTFSAPQLAGGVTAQGIATVANGQVTGIIVINPGSGYTTAPTIAISASPAGGQAQATAVEANSGAFIPNMSSYLQNYSFNADIYGEFAAKYPGSLGNGITVSIADSASYATWQYKNLFSGSPSTSQFVSNVGGSNDEMHVVVVDSIGAISGSPGSVLETFSYVSKASDAMNSDGTTNYYKNVLNNNSQWVWSLSHPVTGANWGAQSVGTVFVSLPSTGYSETLNGGTDDYTKNDGIMELQWETLTNKDLYTIDLVLGGPAGPVLSQYLVNFAASRQDCVAFVSPTNISTGAIITDYDITAAEDVIAFRGTLPSGTTGSYGFLDSGYKYQYDQWNDTYRWVPLNGDVAGLCARTDYTNAAWWSPAGYTRGQIQNVVKLSYNPDQSDRDMLYQAQVNPVVNFASNGSGVILFGDTTLQQKNSAFQSLNIRRLFIVLERSIAKYAKFQLFEFNDSITQAMFVNTVSPFLRGVQSARGISKFEVIADGRVNTPQVIQSKQFVGSILIIPAYSINYVYLNFTAVGPTVSFSSIGG